MTRCCLAYWIAIQILSVTLYFVKAQETSDAVFQRRERILLTSGIETTCTTWKTTDCKLKPTMAYLNNDFSSYFWYPTVPGSCSYKCGDIKKINGISCFDRNLTVVDISNCLHLGIPDVSQVCREFSCTTYKIHALPWNECNSTCGWGSQSRNIACIDNLGNIVRPSYCGIMNDLVETQKCYLQPCDASHWDISSWSTCSKTCGGSKRFRNGTCIYKGQAIRDCSKLQFKLEEVCNSQPCTDYSWLVGPWSVSTNISTNTSYSTRIVECVDGDGMKVDDRYCAAKKPSSMFSCPRTNALNVHCGKGCSNNGVCRDGTCFCFDGWEGLNCERLKSCEGFLGYISNDTVACCKLVDFQQRCCRSSTARLDKNGNCCESGILDACGMCDGYAISVDAHNDCCPSIRDEKGICCRSGILDDCNVCDGDGSTCATIVTLSLSASIKSGSLLPKDYVITSFLIQNVLSYVSFHIHAPEDFMSLTNMHVDDKSNVGKNGATLATTNGSCFQNINISISISLNSPHINMKSSMIKQVLYPGMLNITDLPDFMDSLEVNVSSIEDVTRMGVCGNGVCETGERCTWDGKSATRDNSSCCLHDCPYVASSCRTKSMNKEIFCSGHGICYDTTGECVCFEGHGGPDCSECSDGWTASADGSCIKIPDPLTLHRLHITYMNSQVLHFTTVRQGWVLTYYLVVMMLILIFLTTMMGLFVLMKRWKNTRVQDASVSDDCKGYNGSMLKIEMPGKDSNVIHQDGNMRRVSITEIMCEDLTEEEEAQILEGRKCGILKHVRSFGKPQPVPPMPYVDYFSESDTESESSEEADFQNFIMMSYLE